MGCRISDKSNQAGSIQQFQQRLHCVIASWISAARAFLCAEITCFRISEIEDVLPQCCRLRQHQNLEGNLQLCEAGDCCGLIFVNFEDRDQLRDRQQIADALGRIQQLQIAA